MADYINVTSLNRLAKRVLEQCDPLNDLIVCGEISGFTRHYKSGHLYFTLKDEKASIKTVMFRSQAQLLNFEPQNGMLVLVYGRATIYERDGAFQLYADYMSPSARVPRRWRLTRCTKSWRPRDCLHPSASARCLPCRGASGS